MEEEKPKIAPIGEASGHISLEQARALALQHVRGNPDFYGSRYAGRELVWDVAGSRDAEERHEVELTCRLSRGFRGKPGMEHFIIDKTGAIEFRQTLMEPLPRLRLNPILAVVGLLVVAAGTAGGLASTVVLSSSPTPAPAPAPAVDVPPFLGLDSVALTPDTPARME